MSTSLFMIFLFVPVLVTILLCLNPILANYPNQAYADKLSAYECGFSPILGQGRAPLTISFYLVGILYLVFDLEVAFLVPLVMSLSIIGITGFSIAFIFIFILTAGFIFEISSGALT